MNIPNKLLYIGTGLHLEPLKHFNFTKEFVFIDILPRSELKTCVNYDQYNSLDEDFYGKNFYYDLVELARKNNFVLEETKELDSEYFVDTISFFQSIKLFSKINETFLHICPHLLIFFNLETQQKLKYYISTDILNNMCFDLANDILLSDGLIISGYHPDKYLLEYIKYPINLYCYDNTCYKIHENEEDNLDNLIYWMFNNLDKIQIYFSNIFLVNSDNGILTKYANIEQLDLDVKKFHLTKYHY